MRKRSYWIVLALLVPSVGACSSGGKPARRTRAAETTTSVPSKVAPGKGTGRPIAPTEVGIGVGSRSESLVGAYRGHLRSSFVSFYGPGSPNPSAVSAYGYDATYPHSGLSFRLTDHTVQQIQLNGGCPVQRFSDNGPG